MRQGWEAREHVSTAVTMPVGLSCPLGLIWDGGGCCAHVSSVSIGWTVPSNSCKHTAHGRNSEKRAGAPPRRAAAPAGPRWRPPGTGSALPARPPARTSSPVRAPAPPAACAAHAPVHTHTVAGLFLFLPLTTVSSAHPVIGVPGPCSMPCAMQPVVQGYRLLLVE